MSHVLSLVAAEAKGGLNEADLDDARKALDAAGANAGSPEWLSPDEAAEIPFEGQRDVALAGVRAALAERPVDVNVVPAEFRRKRLLVADMDSTLIEQGCIDELAAETGLRAEVAAITERAMRGEIAFEPALRERVALLKNLPVNVVDEIIAKRITLTPGGTALVRTMRANGAYTCLVSGGFTLFTGPIGAKIGFHEDRSNRLILNGEKLAGLVEEPILGREAKLATLIELRTRFALAPHETMAVGDGANDLAMLEEAGLGVAFRAKPAVAAAAHARIDHADLSALLYVQGYKAGEIMQE